MNCRALRWLVAGLLILQAAGCTQQKKSAPVAAIVGKDTLTVHQTEMLRPDSMPAGARVTAVLNQRALARQCHTALPRLERDTLLTALMQQLSLRSGVEWNREAAGSLLDAACGLRALLDTTKSIEKVTAYLDSIMGLAALIDGKKPALSAACTQKGAAEIRFDSLLVCLLGVTPEVGRTLEQFILSSKTAKRDTSKASAMVKGLLFDATRAAKTPGIAEPAGPLDNSEAVLKFRNQASIQDTIAKHQVNIRELYKRNLKLNSRLAGKVVLRFRVAADGSVIEATVAQSQIGEKSFLDGLTGYARTIRFKPVPPQAGAMRFEYPFEFAPEE